MRASKPDERLILAVASVDLGLVVAPHFDPRNRLPNIRSRPNDCQNLPDVTC